MSAQILWELRRQQFPVASCFIPFQSAAHWLVVTVKRSASAGGCGEELVHELARILSLSRAGSFVPKVLLMDEDIDPANLDELLWAFATRNHPERGQFLFRDQKLLPLVAFLTDEERKAGRGARVIYNCLPSADCPPDRLPRRSSFRHLWPKEIQDKVTQNWTRYGFSEP